MEDGMEIFPSFSNSSLNRPSNEQAYHSQYNKEPDLRVMCGMAVLPIKTKYKGPAPRYQGPPGTPILHDFFFCDFSRYATDQPDIIDEAISFFKANVLFRNYEVKGPADRVLVYLTLYISQAINQMVNQSKGGAQKNMFNLAIQNFAVPGDKNFVLSGFVSNPANRAESGQPFIPPLS